MSFNTQSAINTALAVAFRASSVRPSFSQAGAGTAYSARERCNETARVGRAGFGGRAVCGIRSARSRARLGSIWAVVWPPLGQGTAESGLAAGAWPVMRQPICAAPIAAGPASFGPLRVKALGCADSNPPPPPPALPLPDRLPCPKLLPPRRVLSLRRPAGSRSARCSSAAGGLPGGGVLTPIRPRPARFPAGGPQRSDHVRPGPARRKSGCGASGWAWSAHQ